LLGITLLLAVTALALRMEVVDGALAMTRLFGRDVGSDIRPADVALRPLFRTVAYIIFYGGLSFGVLACADFGPNLLSPGRIEHLLALPVRRHELLLGTFVGVLGLALLGSLYGAGGLVIIMAVKTGVWTARPIAAALIAIVTFAALYGPMLTSALFARSAALSAALGGVLLTLGIVAGYRTDLAALFEEGFGRHAFEAATVALPRVSQLADISADLAASAPVSGAALARLLAGLALFGVASLGLGMWRFEAQDF
jgi:Cu-processing system permease protein